MRPLLGWFGCGFQRGAAGAARTERPARDPSAWLASALAAGLALAAPAAAQSPPARPDPPKPGLELGGALDALAGRADEPDDVLDGPAAQDGSADLADWPGLSEADRAARETITAAELHADIAYLASDELLGRATGAPGSALAAAYLAERLRAAGLSPGGDDDTFLSATGMIGWDLAREGTPVAFADAGGVVSTAALGSEVLLVGGPPATGRFEILVVRRREELPALARPDTALLVAANVRQALAWLKSAGMDGGRGWGALLLPGPERATASMGDSTHALAREGEVPRLALVGALRDRALAGAFTHVDLDLRAQGEPREVHNVVARLPGAGTPADPALAGQIVVLSAHYDHIGTRPPPADAEGHGAHDGHGHAEADLIFNGADDDASGVAAVLELAQAFARRAAAGQPPARTLLVLLATGEELGLLGTEAFLERDDAPLAQTVANINFEMLGRPDALAGGPGRPWFTGPETSNLFAAWVGAGLPLLADPRPEQQFHRRSDNMAFVRRGVVGHSFSSFGLHDDYHGVDDEVERIDAAHMESCVRTAFDALLPLVDGALTPRFLPAEAPGAR